MGEILQDFSPAAVVAAIESNIYGFTLFGGLPGGEVHDDERMLWYISGLPCLFNNVFRVHLEPAEADALIEQILARFRARGIAVSWMVGPSSRPVDLGRYLEAHGLVHVADWAGMAVDLDALNEDVPAPPGLVVERVTDLDGLRRWASVLTSVMADPRHAGAVEDALVHLDLHHAFERRLPWRCYLGVLDGEPVACSALLLAGGAAAVHAVGTMPQARGKGIGSQITLVPLRDGRAEGYRVGVLKASTMGYPVYLRLGFKEYHRFPIYGQRTVRA